MNLAMADTCSLAPEAPKRPDTVFVHKPLRFKDWITNDAYARKGSLSCFVGEYEALARKGRLCEQGGLLREPIL
jgi:hypothetical protein